MHFKIFSFLFYTTHAPLKFMNMYFSDIGLTATQIGTMHGVSQALSLLAFPLWGLASDYFQANKKLLVIGLIGTMLVSLSFLTTQHFVVIGLLLALFSFFQRPTNPLADSLLLGHLGKNSEAYGQYRVFGSLGYAMIGPLFGVFMERTSSSSLFISLAILLGITLVSAIRLPEVKSTVKVNKVGDLRYAINNRQLLIFMLFVFLVQLTCRFDGQYFSLYLIANGGREAMLGTTMTLAAASELLVLPFSRKVISRFSMSQIFLMATCAYGARWISLALFPIPAVILASHLLHGLSFGLFHVGSVYYINATIGEQFRSTGQNLYASASSLSSIVGSFIGGIMFDTIGGNNLYFLSGIIVLVVGVVYSYTIRKSSKVVLTG